MDELRDRLDDLEARTEIMDFIVSLHIHYIDRHLPGHAAEIGDTLRAHLATAEPSPPLRRQRAWMQRYADLLPTAVDG